MADRYEYDDEGPPRARKDDVWTSHESGRHMTKELRRRQYNIILDAIREHGPGTIHVIANNCVLRLDQVHKRLPEMEGKPHYMVWRPGEVEDGPSRRACKVWHEDTRPRKSDGTLITPDDPTAPQSPMRVGAESVDARWAGTGHQSETHDVDEFGPAVILDDSNQ